jgi:hypothetical protein
MPHVTVRVHGSEREANTDELVERARRKVTDIMREGVGAVLVVYRKAAANLYYDACAEESAEPGAVAAKGTGKGR